MQMYVGTCGFTEKALDGAFYPAGLKPNERITWYADRFSAVEIDSSYYGLPSERNSALYVERTPDDFIFNFKAFALMTGHPVEVSRLGKALSAYLPEDFEEPRVGNPFPGMLEAAFEMFVSALSPLAAAGKLGAILFQFPPWFACTPENKKKIERCRELMPDYDMAVEFRHGSWVAERTRKDTLRLLEADRMAYVCVDEPRVKDAVPPVVEVTAPFSYVRFHGRNSEAWTKRGASVSERFRYLYGTQELFEWVPRVRSIAERTDRAFLMFNNCFNTYAIRNAQEMAEMLGLLGDKVPFELR
ncbi:MAG: DUF72 domain-containing protein [Candidatus Aquicultorales bacterium]